MDIQSLGFKVSSTYRSGCIRKVDLSQMVMRQVPFCRQDLLVGKCIRSPKARKNQRNPNLNPIIHSQPTSLVGPKP